MASSGHLDIIFTSMPDLVCYIFTVSYYVPPFGIQDSSLLDFYLFLLIIQPVSNFCVRITLFSLQQTLRKNIF